MDKRARARIASSAVAIGGSAFLVMCAPVTGGMVGDAMVDTGHMLADALVDTGSAISDSASDATSDAAAQPGCGTSCTTTGVQRLMTAETDPAQRVQGFATITNSASGTEIVVGPVMVTNITTNRSTDAMDAWVAVDCASVMGKVPVPGVGATTSTLGFVAGPTFVPEGSRLCGIARASSGSVYIGWQGFTPYI